MRFLRTALAIGSLALVSNFCMPSFPVVNPDSNSVAVVRGNSFYHKYLDDFLDKQGISFGLNDNDKVVMRYFCDNCESYLSVERNNDDYGFVPSKRGSVDEDLLNNNLNLKYLNNSSIMASRPVEPLYYEHHK